MKKPMAITAESASLIIERHFKKRPSKVTRVHGGLANHVFDARIGRESLVVRMSEDPGKIQVFMKEQWAISAARKINVPTPEILEVCNDVGGYPYMISRKVMGHPVSHARHRNEVLRELGKYAAAINTIETRDYGHIFNWSPNKLSRNRTWAEFLDAELNVDERLEMFRRGQVFTPPALKKLRQHFRLIRNWKDRPHLTHGDLRLKNVILDAKDKICAVLDWEHCTSNITPYWELSISLHDLTMDEKEVFLEGYGLDLKTFIKMAPTIKALNILNYAPAVAIAAEERDAAKLLSFRARLGGIFDLYSL